MLHPHVKAVKGDVIHGNGLVADKPIKVGEIVSQMNVGTPTMTIQELLEKTPEQQEHLLHYAYQCSEIHLAFEGEPERFMNHSCDPNIGWLDDNTMIARRDIAEGEEITYDYAMTEISVPLDMICGCGSPLCRGRVTALDYLNLDWQVRYSDYLPPHTLKAIEMARVLSMR